MGQGREATKPRIAIPANRAATGQRRQTWSIAVRADHVVLRFPPHISVRSAEQAVGRCVAFVRACSRPAVVTVDLFDVQSFDPAAPIVAIRAGQGAVGHVARLELIVRDRRVRIAALSAARVLGMPCVVRGSR